MASNSDRVKRHQDFGFGAFFYVESRTACVSPPNFLAQSSRESAPSLSPAPNGACMRLSKFSIGDLRSLDQCCQRSRECLIVAVTKGSRTDSCLRCRRPLATVPLPSGQASLPSVPSAPSYQRVSPAPLCLQQSRPSNGEVTERGPGPSPILERGELRYSSLGPSKLQTNCCLAGYK